MEFKINCSPHLNMSEITKRLFNRNFHSDIQFFIGDKIIYAHSLELIKRSIVFEKTLEATMGELKLIPINDCKYDSFFEFIRFIYTDECNINEDNGIEILKLATKYRVIALENEVLRFGETANWNLKCFEHCVCDKYSLAYNNVRFLTAINFQLILETPQFLSLHPDAIYELLKFDFINKDVIELDILNAVFNWIILYCKNHQMTLADGRKQFDRIVRQIRFPTMPIDQIRHCAKQYPELITENDCMFIARQAVFGTDENCNLWISMPREQYKPKTEWETHKCNEQFETLLTVSEATILYGLRIGKNKQNSIIKIEISEIDDKTGASDTLAFVQNVPNYWGHLITSLGDSLRFKPNFKYMINIKYLTTIKGNLEVSCRKQKVDIIVNDPSGAVNIIRTSNNMIEMFFTPLL